MLSPQGIIRVLVIADDPLARAGLAALLAERDDLTVTGRVAADDQLASEIEVYAPDMALWDLGWGVSEESETAQRMSLRINSIAEMGLPLILLLPGPEVAASVWASGVWGLLPRDSSIDHLASAIHAARDGLVVIDPAFVDRLLPAAQPSLDSLEAEELTPREMEVLQLLAEGYSNRAIALQLNISEHTVKFHVNALMSKLGAQSRTEAVVRATRLGLIHL